MIKFFGRIKKVNGKNNSDFETQVIEKLDCVLKAQANMKQDVRQIVREELRSIINERNRRAWWNIA